MLKKLIFICQDSDTERTRRRKKGKRVGDRQEKWNKKKRMNFWTRKNNYCTSGLHLVNMHWHLDSFGPWVRNTSLPLHGCYFKHVLLWMYIRGARVHLSSSPHSLWQKRKKKKKKLDPMIHSFSFSVLHQDVSHTKMDPVFHSVINQVQSLWVSLHFPALGNRVITKKQETSRFLSPNYHCMTVKWVWLFCLTAVSESGFDHTSFRHTVVGGYHYHVTVSHQ